MALSFLKVPSNNFLRSLLILGMFLLFADVTSSVLAETVSPPLIMDITVQDDLISAVLVNAPLIDVLQQIKQEFGFKAHFHGNFTELITLSFTDIPLGKCLRQLTANHSLSVVSLPATRALEEDAAKQISEVWILSRSKTSKTFNIPPAEPLTPAPALTNETINSDGEFPEQPENEEQESVPLDQLLNNPNTDKSALQKAITDLAEIGDSASVMALAEFLDNEDKEVRQLLINGISSFQNEESTQVLGQVLQTDSDPEIRKIAVRALGRRQNDSVAKAFVKEALNDADEEVKALADQLITE